MNLKIFFENKKNFMLKVGFTDDPFSDRFNRPFHHDEYFPSSVPRSNWTHYQVLPLPLPPPLKKLNKLKKIMNNRSSENSK